MRIAVLTSLYPTSVRPLEGVFAERRWTRMQARGHALRVVQPLPLAPRRLGPRRWTELGRTPGREERAGIPVERPRYLHLPGRALRNARAFSARGVRALLAGGRPDVVVADYAWPAAMAAEALRAAGVPFVVHGRGSDVLQVAGEAGLAEPLARCLRTAGHWCAVSRDLVRRMDELGGRPGHGVLVPNGVDGELFAPRERAAARAALGLDPRAELVLVVGHLIERKDPLLALEAFGRLARRRPAARLVLIGRGPLRARLEERLAGAAPAGTVRLVGEVAPEELARWYAAANALLLCSRREGRPNVVLEALACGLPVLATPAGGTGELLDGLPGALCAERDPEALAAALARLLDAPPGSQELRERVAGLTWERSLDALEGCLRQAIAATGAAAGARA